jgi:hypothetical protein
MGLLADVFIENLHSMEITESNIIYNYSRKNLDVDVDLKQDR